MGDGKARARRGPARLAAEPLAPATTLSRWWPFGLSALVAQITGGFGGPVPRLGLFAGSTALVPVAALMISRPARPGRPWLLAASVTYVAALTLLILAQPAGVTGLTIAFLLPVVALAVYGRRSESAATVVAVVAALLLVSVLKHAEWMTTVRSVLLWAAIGSLVCAAVHSLREHVERIQSDLRRQASSDPLTGLANRRGLKEGIAVRRGRRPYAMLSIDVDGLKVINDTRGHAVGDSLLQGVANACASVLRGTDIVARVGGDEFAAFIADAGLADGRFVAARIGEVAGDLEFDGVRPSVSIGVASGEWFDDPEDVLARADMDMYRSRGSGRRTGVGVA